MDEVDYFLMEGARYPSFKGINLHLTLHCLAWFGDLTCGYNDYAIDAFTAATGIAVPVDRKDPMRGKLYADWIMANAKDQWIDFRCRELAKFYKKIAAMIANARPDLRLVLTSFNGMTFMDDADYRSPEHTINSARAGGLDPKYFTDCPNIVLNTTRVRTSSVCSTTPSSRGSTCTTAIGSPPSPPNQAAISIHPAVPSAMCHG